MVDGCSRFQAFLRITFPLLAPGPGRHRRLRVHPGVERVHLRPGRDDRATTSRRCRCGCTPFNDGNRGTDWGAVMAGSTLMAIPVVIFFLIVQGRMVAGPHRRGGEGMTDLDGARAAACCCPASRARRCRDGCAALLAEGLGGVCLFGSNTADGPDASPSLTARVRARRRRRGRRRSTRRAATSPGCTPATGSPVLGAAALGAVDDLALTRATGAADRRRARRGRHRPRPGPVADVNSQPRQPGHRRPQLRRRPGAGRRARRRLGRPGCRRPGVAACAKHFPGHGDTAAGLPPRAADRRRRPRRRCSRASWCRSRAAVEAGVAAVMTSHIVVPAVDPDAPGHAESRRCSALLRDELGFDGVDRHRRARHGRRVAPAAASPRPRCWRSPPAPTCSASAPTRTRPLVRAVQAAIVAAVRSGRLAEQRLPRRPPTGRAAAPRGLRGASSIRRRPLRQLPAPGARSLVEGELPDLAGAEVVRVETAGHHRRGRGAVGSPPDRSSHRTRDRRRRTGPAGPAGAGRAPAARRPGLLRGSPRGAGASSWWSGAGPARTTAVPTDLHARLVPPGAAAVTEVLRKAGWDR